MNSQAGVATPEEIKAGKYRCWFTGCKGKAWFIDWSGWHYCIRHIWRKGLKYEFSGIRQKWFYITSIKINL